jgi:hypothetical protein
MLLSDRIKLISLSLITLTLISTVVYCAITVGTTDYFIV